MKKYSGMVIVDLFTRLIRNVQNGTHECSNVNNLNFSREI